MMERKFIQLKEFRPTIYSKPQIYQPKGGALPDKVDLRHLFGPVENQLNLGACSAFAATQWYSAWQVALGKPWIEFDELAQYWEERNLEGTVDTDSGAFIHDAVKVLENDGVMPEQGYNTANFKNKPDESKFIPGTMIPAEYVKQIDPMDLLPGVLDALAHGYPVIFGMLVFPDIKSEQVAKTGILPFPTQPEQSIGGHAMVLWGYDRTNVSFRTVDGRNQWGEDWGDKGNIHIQWEYFAAYASECYVIEDPNLHSQPSPAPAPAPAPQPTSNKIVVELYIGKTQAFVNSQEVTLPTAPIIQDNVSLVPDRFIGEAFGATVDWNQDLQKVTLTLQK